MLTQDLANVHWSQRNLMNFKNIAKMLNLDIKKQGKTGRVNIKKEELIEMIAV